MFLLSFLQQVGGSQNILNPGGAAARSISTLSWIVFIIFLAVSVIMWVLIAWVALRKRGRIDDPVPVEERGGESWILVGGFLIPAAILTVIFVLNLDTMSGFPIHYGVDPPPEIIVIGHQWWWEVQYVSGPVTQYFTTADEIHIPAGRDVDIELHSADVIHSFWVPELNGKEDLIPGQPNMIRLHADNPGTYRGQCAEFCGVQHAHMILLVIAQPPDEYEAWVNHESQPAAEPTEHGAQQGEQIFLSSACALCHTIRGTPAGGSIAPDLTHLANRKGLASNALVNDTANLEAWVTHAQSLKPNVVMPDLTQYTGVELRSLVAYLQQLK